MSAAFCHLAVCCRALPFVCTVTGVRVPLASLAGTVTGVRVPLASLAGTVTGVRVPLASLAGLRKIG